MKRPKIVHSLVTLYSNTAFFFFFYKLYSNIAGIDILLTCLKKRKKKKNKEAILITWLVLNQMFLFHCNYHRTQAHFFSVPTLFAHLFPFLFPNIS